MCPNNNKSGFTLIEALLAITIGAIIMATVYHVFATGIQIDARSRYVHKHYLEVLKTDYILSRDLENAIFLDLSISYPDLKIFSGKAKEIEFFIRTITGIKRVRYFAGRINRGTRTQTIIGAHQTRNSSVINSKEDLPIELLLRQELGIGEWVNQGIEQAPLEIIATSIKKDTFKCRYAQKINDLSVEDQSRLSYQDQWAQNGLPMAVSCQYSLYDPKNPNAETIFKREMFTVLQREN